ncbi:hypothetical protein PENTCL1PPCAC_17416, partial [Pristionchus entomophagus]
FGRVAPSFGRVLPTFGRVLPTFGQPSPSSAPPPPHPAMVSLPSSLPQKDLPLNSPLSKHTHPLKKDIGSNDGISPPATLSPSLRTAISSVKVEQKKTENHILPPPPLPIEKATPLLPQKPAPLPPLPQKPVPPPLLPQMKVPPPRLPQKVVPRDPPLPQHKYNLKKDDVPPRRVGPSDDDLIANVENFKRGNARRREEMRINGLTLEKLKTVHDEMEKGRNMRRHKIKSWTGAAVTQGRRGSREEGDLLLSEGGDATDEADSVYFCQLVLNEEKMDEKLFGYLETPKNGSQGIVELVALLVDNPFGPIKISEWAEAIDLDDYYLLMYAKEVCGKLPSGIVRVKGNHFIPGEAMEELITLIKNIFSHEVKEYLVIMTQVSEKDICYELSVAPRIATPLLEIISAMLVEEERPGGELYYKMKAIEPY